MPLSPLGCLPLLLLFAFLAVVAADCPASCSGHGTCSSNICRCDEGWVGDDCSILMDTISSNTPWIDGHAIGSSYHFYVFSTTATTRSLKIEIRPQGEEKFYEECDLYVKFGSPPSTDDHDYAAAEWGSEGTIDIPNPKTGNYYVGVYAASWFGCTYQIRVADAATTTCPTTCVHGTCDAVAQVCNCQTGYIGAACDVEAKEITMNTPVEFETDLQSWTYARVIVPAQNPSSDLSIIMDTHSTPIELHDCDIYVKFQEVPTFVNWDVKDTSLLKKTSVHIPRASAGSYFIGVYGYNQCSYSLVARLSTACVVSKCSSHGVCEGETCRCRDGYSGEACEEKTDPLSAGLPTRGYVASDAWNFYRYHTSADQVRVKISQLETGDCDLYVKFGSRPTLRDFDFQDVGHLSEFFIDVEMLRDDFFIGVYGLKPCEYNVVIEETYQCPSSCNQGVCMRGYCVCHTGWIGDVCDQEVGGLKNAVAVEGRITSSSQWIYFNFTSSRSSVLMTMKERTGDLSLRQGFLSFYVDEGREPKANSFSYAETNDKRGLHSILLTLDHRKSGYKDPVITWVIGVTGNPFLTSPVDFDLVVWEPPAMGTAPPPRPQ